jgi:hypothetical protein
MRQVGQQIRQDVGSAVRDWVPPIPPVSPMPPVPPAAPARPVKDSRVSEEERLTVLRMLQEKKISIEEAEKLLEALEGKS